MAKQLFPSWFRSSFPRALAIAHSLVRRVRPVSQLDRQIEPTVGWLLHAHSISEDGGLPAFYDLLRHQWAPSYPETTGYIIPTLLACASVSGQPALRQSAMVMAEYLLHVQQPEGCVSGWGLEHQPFIFDTGQVLFGWLAALGETGDNRYRAALLRAADWLVDQQEPGGYWTRYQFGGHVKTWDARVGWALVVVGQTLECPVYAGAGRRCLDWTLTQQGEDGWFRHSSLEPNEPPVTHVIAYTVEALLESGILLGEGRYIHAGRLTADVLLAHQRPNGSLSACWAPGWQPLSRFSCLTGDAQMAKCWLRLFQYTGESRYLEAGQRALVFVASTQCLDDRWPHIQGAVAGSWPIFGRYLRWRYPNWAAKFFLDALLLWQQIRLSAAM